MTFSNQLIKVPKISNKGIQSNLIKPFLKEKTLKQLIKKSQPLINQYKNIEVPNIQKNIINFYHPYSVAPFVPLVAKGPWIIGHRGEIIYDVGGYGMLSFGHNPDWVAPILSQPQVMANVMTPNIIQQKMTQTLQEHIGINRELGCPYSHFAFLNSGSEAMELALRISDLSKQKKPSAFIVAKKGFHGRTSGASKISDSCLTNYQKYLKSFKYGYPVFSVEMNNWPETLGVFRKLSDQYHIEAVILEPIMGEGNPGKMIELQFYRLLRRLTKEHNSKLIIDSVQAGLRGTGFLSVTDYHHLMREQAPDIEIFSKAINSGQYPLSVLAATMDTYKQFQVGIYGNTMTCNPRGLAIGIETLNNVTPEVRYNIKVMGRFFNKMLTDLQNDFPHLVSHVSGTGLIQAIHIKDDYPVNGFQGLEYQCRINGLNVIHGGENALRFTPHFLINKQEIDLIKKILVLTFCQYINN